MPPGILPVLDVLGVRDCIETAGFFRPSRAMIAWSRQASLIREHAGTAGFQVDRARFDKLLLDAAFSAGVISLQPASVNSIKHQGDAGWLLEARHLDKPVTVKASFMIDASGKGGLWQPSALRVSAPTLALYAYWRNAPLAGVESRVEAGDNGWYWGAPLPDGTFNAVVFVDPDHPALTARKGAENAYLQLLQASELLRPCLQGERVSPVLTCNASAYVDRNSIGTDFIKVGEAAFSIDPLSSQGVQAAMMSALQASIVVHTMLTQPAQRAAARQFHLLKQQESVTQHARWAAAAYADQDRHERSAFWRQRSSSSSAQNTADEPAAIDPPVSLPAQTRVRLCPRSTWVEFPALRGDVVVPVPALTHPSLQSPVAFVADVELFPVLALLQGSETLGSIRQKVNRFLPQNYGEVLVNWLLQHEILVPAGLDSR